MTTYAATKSRPRITSEAKQAAVRAGSMANVTPTPATTAKKPAKATAPAAPAS
jgi:hypothetical protein